MIEASESRSSVLGRMVPILALLCSALLILYPRIIAGLGCPPNDLYIHYNWAAQFSQSLAEGVTYPRWTPELFGGLGGPVFIYYAPGYFYLISLANFLSGDLWLAMRLVEWLSTAACGLLVLFFFRRWNLPVLCGWLAALLTQSAPFFLLNTAYISGMPWHAANVFVLATILMSIDGWLMRRAFDPRLSLCVAAVAFTHTLSLLMLVLTLPAGVLATAMCETENGRFPFRRLVGWGISFALGIGIAAVYLLPSLATTSLINSGNWREVIDWHDNFLAPVFTGSRWKIYQYGIGLGLLFCLGVAFSRWRSIGRDRSAATVIACVTTVSASAAIFWSSELSYPVWRVAGQLQMIQYPYRFFQVASLALACVLPLAWLPESTVPAFLRRIAPVAVMIWLVSFAGVWAKIMFIDGRSVRDELASYPQRTASQKEYLPANSGSGWSDYVQRGGFVEECASHSVRATTVENHSHHRAWKLVADSDAQIRLPLFSYPSWRIQIDGRAAGSDQDVQDQLIRIRLGPGSHRVEAIWQHWPYERAGHAVSTSSLAILAVAGLSGVRRKKS